MSARDDRIREAFPVIDVVLPGLFHRPSHPDIEVFLAKDATPEQAERIRSALELGLAWSDAEAALPEGWELDLGNWQGGTDGVGHGYQAQAGHPKRFAEARAEADSPATALRALVMKLRVR